MLGHRCSQARWEGETINVPVILLPAEVQHPESAVRWALATIRTNASFSPSAEPYGGTETGILDDQVWFTHYLVALARLTLEGWQKVDAARGDTMEGAS